ncbi:MAG: NVEALA domain-containing protein [Dysgonamonadaceae bacterium]|jgi:hypothetical protein|nr:NVEALA domain-containing protein [Dysgonamonadaceae bacterium]
MESKKKMLVALAVIILGVVNVHFSWNPETSGIFIENVEALADGENGNNVRCYMLGSVVCPADMIAIVFYYHYKCL